MDDVITIVVAVLGTGVLNTLVNHVITSREKKKNKDTGVCKATRLLMKTQLRSLCMTYIEQGWIYEDELEDLMAMHGCYHDDLDGNGFLTKLMSRVESLEIRGVGVK